MIIKNLSKKLKLPGLIARVGLIFWGFGLTSIALAQLRYETEYPVIGYSNAVTTDPYSTLIERINAGEVSLEHVEGRGYLDSLLAALDIDISSQLLVFSKTSLKSRFITARTPRALYFNDEVYVAFIGNTRAIEIAAMDPDIGPVFFGISQNPEDDIVLDRELNRCLRCHDSYSLSGGGVPRFLLTSVLADSEGEIVSHEISVMTNTSTPLQRRWGGWYVSGTHGDQQHMGNLMIDSPGMLSGGLNLTSNGNKTQLTDLFDLGPYPAQYSDVVALLVIEHQVELQNILTRVNYEVRTQIDAQGEIGAEQLAEITEPLVRSMLMANEIALTSPVKGKSGFMEYFQRQSPMDSQGRSLRQLDLNTRTFTYPLSYLIYSNALNALQSEAKAYLFRRINEVLSGQDQSEIFAHLNSTDKTSILEILRDTKADFFDTLD